MATLTSQEILNATVSMGVSKANQCWIARAANTLLAGMYIAIGGFLAIRIGLALPWEQWGGMSKLIFGAVFSWSTAKANLMEREREVRNNARVNFTPSRAAA